MVHHQQQKSPSDASTIFSFLSRTLTLSGLVCSMTKEPKRQRWKKKLSNRCEFRFLFQPTIKERTFCFIVTSMYISHANRIKYFPMEFQGYSMHFVQINFMLKLCALCMSHSIHKMIQSRVSNACIEWV